jgi:hypothetical protein
VDENTSALRTLGTRSQGDVRVMQLSDDALIDRWVRQRYCTEFGRQCKGHVHHMRHRCSLGLPTSCAVKAFGAACSSTPS